jgi:rhodanese-related sulfurtransferase
MSQRISLADARRRIEAGVPLVFLDVRQPAAWDAAPDQLPGSIRIPIAALPSHLAALPRGTTIVAYCT